jgi:hypothetical protein
MSPWTKFATNYYKEQKKSNPLYKFKDALVDAGKIYKKSVASPIGSLSNKVGKNVRNTVSKISTPIGNMTRKVERGVEKGVGKAVSTISDPFTRRRRRGSRRRGSRRRGSRRSSLGFFGGNDAEPPVGSETASTKTEKVDN